MAPSPPGAKGGSTFGHVSLERHGAISTIDLRTLPRTQIGRGEHLIDWAWLSYLGLCQVGLAYVFVTRAMPRVPAFEASLILMVEPDVHRSIFRSQLKSCDASSEPCLASWTTRRSRTTPALLTF